MPDFLPFEERVIRREGVRLFNVTYFDGALAPLLDGPARTCRIKYDPRNMSAVFVELPTGGHLRVPCADLSRPAVTLWEQQAAIQTLRAEGRANVNETMIFAAIEAQRRVLAEAQVSSKVARRAIRDNLTLAFDTFPVLKERRNQLAGTMSGGQQQMLAIARALMSSPRLLLIDEPSVGLSPLLVSQTITKIGELNAHLGLTVLMAEQNFNQAIRIANRGYIIVHGEIVVAADSVDELRGNDIVKRLYLGGVA